ncbi:hypothetical protein Anas_04775 [Armadillidium nasatum]|uniref:Uncharacterized protein n=1 Tax=Armadillidium nasatum TaxID=96803 RepID=A0A5N5SK34_9CRUS|nr:hypothetical protein Anas_04775 [Armadillidium nasatum]
MVLMDKYIPTCLDVLKIRFKKLVPVPEISHLMMLCQLLDCLLTPENIPSESGKEIYEIYFVFAAVWAFGSTMYQDGNIDYRVEFSKWWQQEFKTIKFPGNGTVFDYFIDKETSKFVHWSEKVPRFDLDPDAPLQVDKYGTVQPHTLIRQHMDYGHWYDRTKHTLKDINNVQYVACMNPTAGSFTINPRLQRHFAVFAVSFPNNESLTHIYTSLLDQHLKNPNMKFQSQISRINQNFTINKCLILQGLLFSSGETLKQPLDLARAWLHETQRVYGDRLLEEKDLDSLTKLQGDVIKKVFEELDEAEVMAKPNVFCHFARGVGDPRYLPIKSWTDINGILTEALNTYNELNAAMNLVLFEAAMAHVCRLILYLCNPLSINRILECPRGNALLVGVGGSGKQSLARLAAFISGLEVFQITLTREYGLAEFRSDLSSLYIRAGMKNLGTVFLLTDAHIPDEKFLVLINDLLASGEIPDLFHDDEVENIVSSVRNEVKSTGMPDNRENCWRFFIDRVRRNLKIVLCFSPVGSTLRYEL